MESPKRLLMPMHRTDLLESKVLGVVSNDINGNITVSYAALGYLSFAPYSA